MFIGVFTDETVWEAASWIASRPTHILKLINRVLINKIGRTVKAGYSPFPFFFWMIETPE